MLYIGIVIVFMFLFFPLPDVPYHLVKNFLFTAKSNFPMLLSAISILILEFLIPLFVEGRTWGQREFGIGILFSGEAATGGLILSLTFRVATILLLSYAPGLLAIKIGGFLGYAKVLAPYHIPIMVAAAVPAWVTSWLFPLLSRNTTSVLDFVSSTVQTEERLLPAGPELKAIKPLAGALGFLVLFGLLTPSDL